MEMPFADQLPESDEPEKICRQFSTSYWNDQSAARPIISVARHGATCSFKSNNVFMTPTGEDNQYTCNMLIRREYRTLLLPTKQDKLLVNAIIRWTTIVDQLLKPGRQNTTNVGFCWIFDVLCVFFS